MFPGNNIASVGVKLSCLHTEGVFTAVDTLHKQTQEQCTLYYFSVVSLSWMKWRLELICIVVLSYQRKNCFAWLNKYSQTETRIFYPRPVLYVINSVGPGTVKLHLYYMLCVMWPKNSFRICQMVINYFTLHCITAGSQGKNISSNNMSETEPCDKTDIQIHFKHLLLD